MKISILVPVSDPNYYYKYESSFWNTIRNAIKATNSKDIIYEIYIGIDVRDPEYEMHRWDEVDEYNITTNSLSLPNTSINIIHTNKCPGRSQILYELLNDINSDYYTFIDLDDEIDKRYFIEFYDYINSIDIKPEIVVGQAVRMKDDLIIPKPYLCWRKLIGESDLQMFISGRYGNSIWGRFFSRDLISRICDKHQYDLYDLDGIGWGEEYPLHNLLFFSTKTALGFCDSLYYWHYRGNTLSKVIDKEQSIKNIEKSLDLPEVPEDCKESLRNRLLGLLNKCSLVSRLVHHMTQRALLSAMQQYESKDQIK